jgi:hypothetical protein
VFFNPGLLESRAHDGPSDDHLIDYESVCPLIAHVSPNEVASWSRLNKGATTPVFRAAAPISR